MESDDEVVVCAASVVVLEILRRKKKRKKRAVWVKSWLAERDGKKELTTTSLPSCSFTTEKITGDFYRWTAPHLANCKICYS